MRKAGAAIAAIRNGLMERRPEIRVEASADEGQELLKEALSRDPRLMALFTGVSLHSSGAELTIAPRYPEDAPALSEVIFANYLADVLAALRQAGRDFRKKAVIVAGNGLEMADSLKLFVELNEVSMPLLSAVRTTEAASFSWLPYTQYTFQLEYRLGTAKLQMMRLEAEREARWVSERLFTPDMPSQAKIYLAHNYLCRTVTYRRGAGSKLERAAQQCAYGALVERHCVCQGFAEAFQMLTELGGVGCRAVEGTILASGEGHAWNLVTADGITWAHLDATWDSPFPRPDYAHFCVGDAAFRGLRQWNRSFTPSCDGDDAILPAARAWVKARRSALLARGIPRDVLDV